MLLKRITALLTALITLVLMLPVSAMGTAGGGRLVLSVCTAGQTVIAPEYIEYENGMTLADALMASGHDFTGIEQGFIYAVDDIDANYSVFCGGSDYSLSAPASDFTAVVFTVSAPYSEEMISLVIAMADYTERQDNAHNYPPAANAYNAALTGLRSADAAQAGVLLEALLAAISEYEAMMNGARYSVVFGSSTGTIADVALTDAYGNEYSANGSSISVVAGEYRFRVSDGSRNRVEGSVSVAGDTSVSVTLPTGEWFGTVELLDRDKNPYPTDGGIYLIPDTSGVSSVYLRAMIGAVPDNETTRLRAIYVGVDGVDRSDVPRSWNSNTTNLNSLIDIGLVGRDFRLDAIYEDADGFNRIQSRAISIERTPTLASLSVISGGSELMTGFAPLDYDYAIDVIEDYSEIFGVPFTAGCFLLVDGSSSGAVDTAEDCSVSVTVGTSGSRITEYVINFTKKQGVSVTVLPPDGAEIEVFNPAGASIAGNDGVYRLIPGVDYTYVSTADTYCHAGGTFTAAEGLTVTAAMPITAPAISETAFYSASNVNTRVEYVPDTPFSGSVHTCSYVVSDAVSSIYAQATAQGWQVTAHYLMQTKNDNDGKPKSVTVTKTVDPSGAATALTSCLCQSGYTQFITLTAEKTANSVRYWQDYELAFARKLHIKSLAVSYYGAPVILKDATGNTVSFDRDMTDYYLTLNGSGEELTLAGHFINEGSESASCGGYYAVIEGSEYELIEDVSTIMPEDASELAINVFHADPLSESTVYTLHLEYIEPVEFAFAVEPEDASVFVCSEADGSIPRRVGNVFYLLPGGEYCYTVTSTGFIAEEGSVTAPQENGSMSVVLTPAPDGGLAELDSEWPSFRADEYNNGVISAKTPIAAEDAALYWATKIGEGYSSSACGCPIIVGDKLIVYAGNMLYKVNKRTGAIEAEQEMDHSSSFAICGPTYAEGIIFIGLADGAIQAFNADTLEPLWIYHDPLGGQPNCPIAYHDGRIYTGFWQGETLNANFVCLTVTDEDPASPYEEKTVSWRYTSRGGYYWAGAYVCDDYVIVGTDDGAAGYTTGHARVLSLDPMTGELLSSVALQEPGDVRSSVTMDGGKAYFTTKGGYFYRLDVDENGGLSNLKKIKLDNGSNNANTPAMSTCTPTVCNGRAYVGVCGTGQFGAYSGHNITVIDLNSWCIAYSVPTQGYPQTSGILTDAYYEENGAVYVYFFDNYTPGKLRMLRDRPGLTSAELITTEYYIEAGVTYQCDTAYNLFTPSGEQAQYAICSPIVDSEGTIYFKNDSAYLMALGSMPVELSVERLPDKLDYRVGEIFDPSGMVVTARFANGTVRDVTEQIVCSDEPLTLEDTQMGLIYGPLLYHDQDGEAGVMCDPPFTFVSITVSEGGLLIGDADLNGAVNANDALLILRYALGIITLEGDALAAADADRNGTVNANDALLILRYSLGLVPLEKGKAL